MLSEAPFDQRTDTDNIGAFGHSNGGITTLGAIAHDCCREPRIDAAISMSALAAPFNNGDYDFSRTKPLLLIHGSQDHCHNWDWTAEQFYDDYHVIVPDLRGHGDSEWVKGSPYNLLDYVYDIAQLVHQQEVPLSSQPFHQQDSQQL